MSQSPSYDDWWPTPPPDGVFEPVTMDIVSIYDDVVVFGGVLNTKFYKKKPWHRRIATVAANIHPADRFGCSTEISCMYVGFLQEAHVRRRLGPSSSPVF